MPRRFQQDRRRPSRRRGWQGRVLFVACLVVLAGAAVWFAPTVIALSPLRHRIVAMAAADFPVRLSARGVSLGWLSPVVLRDLVAEDSQGRPMARASVLRTDKPLASLLAARHDRGVIRIDAPELSLVLRGDGSNLEDAIQSWLDAPASTAPPACKLEITNGVVEATEAATGKRWRAEQLNLSVAIPGEGKSPLTLRGQTVLPQPAGSPGELAVECTWHREASARGGQAGTSRLLLRTACVPLEVVGAVLQRFCPGLQLGGFVTASAWCDWAGSEQTLHLEHAQVDRFDFALPSLLGGDRVSLGMLRSSGEVSRRRDAFQWSGFRLDSELGHLELRGSSKRGPQAAGKGPAWFASLAQAEDLKLRGDIELAALAAMLPSTLRVREGTRVTAGKASWAVEIGPSAEGRRWNAQLLLRDLDAMHQGRRIVWERPVELVLAARQDGPALTLDQLACRSEFLTGTARGSLAEGSLSLQADLARFLAQASQLLDLGRLRLAGTLSADVRWRETSPGRVTLEGAGTAEGLEAAIPGRTAWREPRLAARLAATGRLAEGRLQSLEQASAQLGSANDKLEIDLLEPVRVESWPQEWPLQLHAEGEVARWLPRLQSFWPLAGWTLEGLARLDASLKCLPDRVEFASLRMAAQGLRGHTDHLWLDEPAVQLEMAGNWDRRQRQLTARSASLASNSLAARGEALRISLGQGGVWAEGAARFRFPLERMVPRLLGRSQPGEVTISGETTGELQLAQAGGRVLAKCSAEIKDFSCARRARPTGSPPAQPGATEAWHAVWSEPRIVLAAEGEYAPSQEEIRLSRIQASGQSLSFTARGSVSNLRCRRWVELEGQLAYDLEKLLGRAEFPFAGQVQLVGRGTRPFTVRWPLSGGSTPAAGRVVREAGTGGPLRSSTTRLSALDDTAGKASLAWQSGNVAGFALGPGELEAQWASGIVRVSPLEVAVSEGCVRLTPQLLLNQQPAVLVLPPGSAAEQVRLSPQMCHGWFKYLAPLVADATVAEGRFSASLEGAMLPVAKPSLGDIKGVLAIHSARVGPGPLAREMLSALEQVRALLDRRTWRSEAAGPSQWLELPTQDVVFHMSQQRVQHQGLLWLVGDVALRTSGTVGFDESLALVADVPVRDEWLGNDRYLAALKGQVVQLPVGGTLKQPRIDTRALAQLGGQNLRGSATRIIEQELNRGLQRLLQPRGQ